MVNRCRTGGMNRADMNQPQQAIGAAQSM